ncbi:TVP38/TMEM64 family protein [Breoghania sp. L-A4]|uniref:TVP38/TMEM64 family protein n=1 Tax=Breoghania sp. L-A4 TaxID=2304600 RepID=UPI000E35A909|nr:TVP38/TMEM64 family protein [Breoghania sp. L-A4]AXS39227.1 TVP38/TMEM64 family protein [Breoghania sp. L-A4]
MHHVKRWGVAGVIVALMAIGYALGWHDYISMSALIMHRDLLIAFVSAHFALSIVVYCALYVVLVALSFPGASLMTIAGGFLFGWFIGGSLTAVAATIGASVIFLAARTSLGASLKERAGPFMARLSGGFRENAFSYLLFLRLTPVFPFWLVNIAPAIFHVPLRTYAIATFFGIIPGTYAYSFIGAGLDSVIAAQERANPGCASAGTCTIDPSALVTRELIVAFALLGVVSLLPIVLKKLRGRAGVAAPDGDA